MPSKQTRWPLASPQPSQHVRRLVCAKPSSPLVAERQASLLRNMKYFHVFELAAIVQPPLYTVISTAAHSSPGEYWPHVQSSADDLGISTILLFDQKVAHARALLPQRQTPFPGLVFCDSTHSSAEQARVLAAAAANVSTAVMRMREPLREPLRCHQKSKTKPR